MTEQTPDTVPPNGALSTSRARRRVGLKVAVVVIVSVVALWLYWPRITQERVQQTIVSTLSSEARESFYVTGTLTFSSTVESRSEKTWLPGILNLDLGTTTATVRVPGRVAYGFNVTLLRAEDIHYSDEGVVEVRLPRLEIFSVEPEMEKVEIQTDVGWARLHRNSGQAMEEQALQAIRPTMRATAERHLTNSETPELNSAEAIAQLLTTPLEAAGVRSPQFRFLLSSGHVLEVDGREDPHTDG